MAEYSEYKDSGQQWLGMVPSHWSILPGKAIFAENKTKNKDNQESFVLSLSYGKIIPKKDINEGLVPDNYSGYQIVKPGYIIVRCTDLQNDKVSLRTALVQHNGIISGAYLGLIPRDSYNSSFLQYLLFDWDISKELYRYGSGLRQSLSWEGIKYLLLPIPPKEEQEAIVSYLDKVTADIDKAIAAKERIIVSLEERRKIIITHAVTRGINPDSPMKDSGIDWLGEIPAHWDIRKLKSIAEVKGRIGFRGYTNEDMVLKGEGAITLSPSNVNNGRVEFEKCSYLSWSKYYESPEIMVENGHLLFVKTGSSYGKTGIVNALPEKATINPQFYLIKPKNILSQFLNYAFATPYLKYQVEGGVIGSTIPTISQAKIKNFIILSPPLIEQEAILDYLERELSPLDLSITQQKKLIELLRERKNIIINETVTGKVKVI